MRKIILAFLRKKNITTRVLKGGKQSGQKAAEMKQSSAACLKAPVGPLVN